MDLNYWSSFLKNRFHIRVLSPGYDYLWGEKSNVTIRYVLCETYLAHPLATSAWKTLYLFNVTQITAVDLQSYDHEFYNRS